MSWPVSRPGKRSPGLPIGNAVYGWTFKILLITLCMFWLEEEPQWRYGSLCLEPFQL